MPKLHHLIVLPLLCLLLSCSSKAKLSDQVIDDYLKAIQNIQQISPDLAKKLTQGQLTEQTGTESWQQVEKAVQEAGFKDMPDFIQVNGAIALALGQAHGGQFLKDQDKNIQAALAKIDQQLANPKIPATLRTALQEQKNLIQQQYTTNKSWANWVMEGVSQFNDAGSLEVIKRRTPDLQRAFSGR